MTKVLLVEDDANMRSLLRTLLEIEGFQVISEEEINLNSIIKKMITEGPDVIFMDVHLRKANGLEILKAIKTDSLGSKTNIIMTSGEDLKEQCMKSGADGFLLKPYLPEDLVKTLRATQVKK